MLTESSQHSSLALIGSATVRVLQGFLNLLVTNRYPMTAAHYMMQEVGTPGSWCHACAAPSISQLGCRGHLTCPSLACPSLHVDMAAGWMHL